MKIARSLLVLLLTAAFCGELNAAVRVVDLTGSPAAGLMLMRLFSAIEREDDLITFETGDRYTREDTDDLSRFDVILTADEKLIERARSFGIVRDVRELWSERLLFAAPDELIKKIEHLSMAEVISNVVKDGYTFVSEQEDEVKREHERSIARVAGIDLERYDHFVESSRGDVSLMLFIEDEQAASLVWEGTFARYREAMRGEGSIRSVATGIERKIFGVAIGVDWFRHKVDRSSAILDRSESEQARDVIGSFSLGGVRPFAPPQKDRP